MPANGGSELKPELGLERDIGRQKRETKFRCGCSATKRVSVWDVRQPQIPAENSGRTHLPYHQADLHIIHGC